MTVALTLTQFIKASMDGVEMKPHGGWSDFTVISGRENITVYGLSYFDMSEIFCNYKEHGDKLVVVETSDATLIKGAKKCEQLIQAINGEAPIPFDNAIVMLNDGSLDDATSLTRKWLNEFWENANGCNGEDERHDLFEYYRSPNVFVIYL